MRSRHLRGEHGLTIIEIMVVLVIIGVVMAFLAGRLTGAGDKAKARLTKTKLLEVKSHIETFELQYNKLPSQLSDLYRCSDEVTGSGCVPIVNGEEDLLDAWDNPLQYSLSGREYTLRSLGADGADGGSGVDADFVEKGP